MASISKRTNKEGRITWRAVIRLQGHPTVCKTFSRKKEAEDWASFTERDIKLGKYQFQRQNHTYGDRLERFINDGALEHHRSLRDTLRHLDYWKTRFSEYDLVHLTPEFIGKERKLLLYTPTHRGLPRSPGTVNRYFAALSSSLSYAVKSLRWIDLNPCINMKKLKENKGKERTLSLEEADLILEQCKRSKNSYLYCIILLALTTGMRKGEILGLKWNQIDFDNGLAHLRETKNNHNRTVPLVEEVLDEIETIYNNRNPAKEHVFASRTAFGEIDINKAWYTVLKRSGIENLRFHDLRHSFATMAAQQGASNLELSTAMGHKTLQMLKRYTHLEGNLTRKYSSHIS